MSREKRKRIEKLVVYALAGLIGLIVMWIIFAPKEDKDTTNQSSFNATIPEAVQEEMATDKQSAYAKDKVNNKDAEREQIKTIAQSMIEEQAKVEVTKTQKPRPNYTSASATPTEKVVASTEAYRNMNKTLGSFYDTPKVDPEKERMQKELDELKEQLAMQEQVDPAMGVEDQIALMEKSYELAAKYMPNGQSSASTATVTTPEIEEAKSYINGKAQVNTIGEVREVVVSALAQEMSNSEFASQYSQPRNYGFTTAVGGEGITQRNTISAVIHSDQTITDGGAVRMRLTEPMMAGDKLLPRNSMVTGIGKVEGERLNISVNHLAYQGVLIPIDLSVVDSDGQSGIFIPNSMEVSAIKEVAANLGSTMGTTINLNQQDAANQILTEVGKGAIQGASQYVSKKMSEVKVHLKAGYRVMLYQEKN